MSANVAKVQHYVPKFLLRHFGTGKKDKIFVFDKHTGRIFTTNVKNIAAESRFYDFKLEGKDFSIEKGLARVEGLAKPIFKSILETDSLAHMTDQERAALCIFLSMQFTRSKWYREQFRELPRQLKQTIAPTGTQEADLNALEKYFAVPDENELAIHVAQSVISAPKDYAGYFANKVWVLIATNTKPYFLIGDNPIGMQNMNDMSPYGNIGLAVRGIEIYFPISPSRALAMWCPSLLSLFQEAANRSGAGSVARSVLSSVTNGKPLMYDHENMMNFNSIQICHAERFVFSVDGDFTLVRRMISDNEKFRRGPRMKVG